MSVQSVMNPLFKMYEMIYVVTWGCDENEKRVTVASEKQARVLFANLKRQYDASLWTWSRDNVIQKIA